MNNPGYLIKVKTETKLVLKLQSLEFMEYYTNPDKRKKG